MVAALEGNPRSEAEKFVDAAKAWRMWTPLFPVREIFAQNAFRRCRGSKSSCATRSARAESFEFKSKDHLRPLPNSTLFKLRRADRKDSFAQVLAIRRGEKEGISSRTRTFGESSAQCRA